jgi:hypothetical protein
MRRIVALTGIVAGALLGAGCSSSAPCVDPCAPRPVWVPDRVQMRACLEVVPPRVREQAVADLGLCRDVTPVPVCLPVREKVEVRDTATALAPVLRPTCVPEIGYARVQDFRDTLCPKYECRAVPKCGQVTVVTLGVGCGPCGVELIADVCKQCRSYLRIEPVKVGEHLLSLPCGSHLEQTQVGCHCVPIHVGAKHVTCVTGSHLEDRVVGSRVEMTEVDRGVKVTTRGVRPAPKETLPWRYQVVERPCHVPGFWAFVVDEAPAVRAPGVITRAEYEEYLRDAAKAP